MLYSHLHFLQNIFRSACRFLTITASFYIALGCVTNSYAERPVIQYEYDANGNRTKVTDPLSHVSIQSYDALNRPVQLNQPHPADVGQLGQIGAEYNELDQIKKIIDQRNLATTYTYDAFGNLLTLDSPDSGITSNTYDVAGNLKTRMDAKGQLTTYSYDALNRLTQIQYVDGQTITYSYDQGINGLGRLTGITDSTGTIAYSYHSNGRVMNEVRTINAITYTTSYSYNAAGQLNSIAYPTGLIVNYTRDSLGRLSQISSNKNGAAQILASNISYQPFGGVQSFTFGNGANYVRSFDEEGRLDSYTLGSQTVALTYDLAGRIVAAGDSINSSDSKAYTYDNLDRLTAFTAPATNQGYGYDAIGNRTSLTIGANSYSNSISPTSNRLTASTGPTPKTFSFDNNGSITADTVNQFNYDARGRLVQANTSLGNVDYGVNALGQRVVKTAGSTSTVFHYDINGMLIAETSAEGAIVQEYIYLYETPLAVFK